MTIQLPIYQKKYRLSIPNVESVEVLPTDIIIFEGVIALSLDKDSKAVSHKFSVYVDEKTRRQRFISEYLRRGLNEQDAESLYQARLVDEFETVENMTVGAQPISSYTILN